MREATTMNAADEYVVRDAFEALDDDKDGFLDSDQFCTLYLGLFFFPERIKKEDLLRTAGMEEKDSLISVEQALQVLQKVSCVLA